MTNEQRPNHQYFKRTHGCWRSPFQFEIRDWKGFWACSIGFIDRWKIISMVLTVKLFGAFWIETQVDYESDGSDKNEVLHTTEIRKWGMSFMKSREYFTLDENGHDVLIRGEQRFFPFWWVIQPFEESSCKIDSTGTKGAYEFLFFGIRLKQNTELVDGGARIEQDVVWGGGVQVLRRREP